MPRVCGSIFVVFLANGLWHGARWNYLVSGFLHGSYRVTELLASRAISRRGWSVPALLDRTAKIARTLLVFGLMTFAFAFFRGENMQQTLRVLSRIGQGWRGIASAGRLWTDFTYAGTGPRYLLFLVGLIGVMQAVQFLRRAGPLRLRISAQPFWLRWSFYCAGVIAIIVLSPGGKQPFIYFQF